MQPLFFIYVVIGRYLIMRIHWIGKRLIITTAKTIQVNDMYLDNLVHPNLITYPLVMQGFCDVDKKIIQSNSGTTSPVKNSRKIVLMIG